LCECAIHTGTTTINPKCMAFWKEKKLMVG
jgi:hypothetical protein